MKSQKDFVCSFVRAAAASLLCASASLAAAQSEGVLHSFSYTASDGGSPYAGVIADSTGALYGTALYAGPNGQGIVYKLTPPTAGGTWTESIVYSFSGASDGASPASNLVMDSTGAIYGTTTGGGTFNCGTFFQLVPPTSAGWTENSLYQFPCANKGFESVPLNIVQNTSTGAFYGVVENGGKFFGGYIYELAPASGGAWTFTTLHSFNLNPSAPGYVNGYNPWSLILGPSGSLSGTAIYGGGADYGTVYRLTPPTAGTTWHFALLYDFVDQTQGTYPYGLVIGSGGVLYGGAAEGGAFNNGTIYSLTPPSGSGGSWTLTDIHNFADAPGDGNTPLAGVILGPAGSLYGTTAGGGSSNTVCGSYDGCGTVFQLTPGTGGAFTETILHNFASTGGDAINPNPGPPLLRAGSLFGATYIGGANNAGAVYAVHP